MKIKSFKILIHICLCLSTSFLQAQTKGIDRKDFFTDEQVIHVKLMTDIRSLIAEKNSLKSVDAVISCKFPDSSVIEENIMLKQRGHFRKKNCFLSSLMLQFNNDKLNKLAPLKSLKMVGGCGRNGHDEQYLLKEYLIYKIYNLLSEFSFRVRLLHVTYVDTKGKIRPYTQYAFVMEDIDEVAKRNKCREKKLIKFSPAGTNTYQTALLSIFQFMIGNTDWSIPYYHNIKLLIPKKDSFALPIPVAYDFDMTGFVNPHYAIPHEDMGIEKVTQRVYRGFATSIEETITITDLLLKKEKEIFAIINDCALLNQRSRQEITTYLEEFFKTIKDKTKVKKIFITNARID